MSMDTPEPINLKRVERVWRCFDANARLQRWPNKRSEQMLAVWGIWAYLPSDTRWNEAEVSAILRGWQGIGLVQDTTGVTLSIQRNPEEVGPNGERRTIRARFLGCFGIAFDVAKWAQFG